MSRFFSARHAALTPYTPGEQPQDMRYIKLNTNESPFAPSHSVVEAVSAQAEKLNLYCDPDCAALCEAAAGLYGVDPGNILPVNGSDEGLYLAFMAFGDGTRPIAFADITYGFYPVYAELNHIPAHVIPLGEDFTIDVGDYCALCETVVIANPNAPTGVCLEPAQLERVVASNPDNVVVIDEAYVDFGGSSCVALTKRYDNLLVLQTFSKSRSLAGARLGFAVGNEKLIADLITLKYSINPYNVNAMTQRAGIAAIADNVYYMDNCKTIMKTRAERQRHLKRWDLPFCPRGPTLFSPEATRSAARRCTARSRRGACSSGTLRADG